MEAVMRVSAVQTIKFVKENLGKNVRVPVCGKKVIGMIVGWNKRVVIVSFPNKEIGWELLKDERYGGRLRVRSPLNVTFWHADLREVELMD